MWHPPVLYIATAAFYKPHKVLQPMPCCPAAHTHCDPAHCCGPTECSPELTWASVVTVS